MKDLPMVGEAAKQAVKVAAKAKGNSAVVKVAAKAKKVAAKKKPSSE